MTKDSTKGTIELIRTLQEQLMDDDDILGGALPLYCDEVISRLEKYLEKQIANLKRQADEIKAFLETDTEFRLADQMISELDTILAKIKHLKHQDMQFKEDPRQYPLEDFQHFHTTFSSTYYSLVSDFANLRQRMFELVNQKLNELDKHNLR